MHFKHKLLLSQKTHSIYSLFFTFFFFFSNTHTYLLRSNPHTMAPVKSQGSSRRKGKEAIFEPPAALDVGEEAEYSESEHSDEEEAQRNPDSECASLIDPWYNVDPLCGLPFVGETPMFLGPR